jgi:putative transposase
MAITDEVLNELLKDYQKPEDLLGQHGLLKQLQKRLLEKAMGAELTVHLGYGKHDPVGRNSGNSRNGSSPKTLQGEFGKLELATPRDRNGSFEPQIVAKGQRRFEGFDQAIISLYSRGLTTREIEGHLLEIYGVEAVVFGRLSARRIFSGPSHIAGSVFFCCGCRHLSVTRS